ncbi:hypothetical protein KGA65_09415 [Ideonella sp. B7]|uniref:hypothetical protein n=1 Tax=Ideonella benzenivorans TaxID=2831643 RepID=UPI001CED1589|nr:hypothetical protein [Ideonella benzenivorans]MCA6216754.1 hypothetical protein [Ideonella benzenivorans]
MTAPDGARPALLDRDSLRRQALARAAARGRPMAQRRLRWRQWRWAIGRLLRWGSGPALLALAAWAWLQRHGAG